MATSSEEYRKRAMAWIELIDRLPLHERPAAIGIAEQWLEAAASALLLELPPAHKQMH